MTFMGCQKLLLMTSPGHIWLVLIGHAHLNRACQTVGSITRHKKPVHWFSVKRLENQHSQTALFLESLPSHHRQLWIKAILCLCCRMPGCVKRVIGNKHKSQRIHGAVIGQPETWWGQRGLFPSQSSLSQVGTCHQCHTRESNSLLSCRGDCFAVLLIYSQQIFCHGHGAPVTFRGKTGWQESRSRQTPKRNTPTLTNRSLHLLNKQLGTWKPIFMIPSHSHM